MKFSFSQETAISDTTSLIKIGPLIDELPMLDSLRSIKIDTSRIIAIDLTKSNTDQYPLNASGSFFRGINFGGSGNSAINGGLKMQIAGKISDQTHISGVITDESLPIQPDGSTADLDELDKVYIQIDNPSFSMIAGDIVTEEKKISINEYQRNLIGLHNKIDYNDRIISSVIGQSKGTYNRLEIKGQDGNQGPYYLTTSDGKRNIVIASGSEKVWLNGKLLKRGDDLDYVIDYSMGELYFTSKNLLYFDSDIDIEYLYRQTNYNTNYLETGIQGDLFNDSDFQLKFIRENQNIYSTSLNQSQQKLFNKQDEIVISGAYEDSMGTYIFENNIYMYDPEYTESENRFSVVFSPDEDGDYVRKVSDNNRIYYEYLPSRLSAEQRFSPGQTIRAPIGTNILQLNSQINVSDHSSFFLESVLSMKNNNLFNAEDNYSNGSALRLGYKQDNISFQGVDFGFDVEHLTNSKNFTSLGRDRKVDFNENWDMDPLGDDKEIAISKFGANLKSDHTNFQIDLFDLSGPIYKKTRREINLDHTSNYIKKGDLRFNQIDAVQEFNQLNSKFVFLSGDINPFVNLRHEYRNKGYRFDDLLVGVGIFKAKRSFSIGLGKRSDWGYDLAKNLMSLSKNSQFIELDYKYVDLKGWKNEFIYRSRAQKNETNNETISFGSGRLAINYRNKVSPLRLNVILSAQNSVKEFASVVYDSIGTGKGNFRYDPILNEYVRDEYGAFVANTILVGRYKSGKNMNSLTRISYDFSNSELTFLKFLKYRFTLNADYHGSDSNIFYALNNRTAQLFILNNRNEIIYQKSTSSARLRFSIESRINYNGMDLRGWQDKRSDIFRIDSQIPLVEDYFIKYDLNVHSYSLSAGNNYTLERNVEGLYHELGLKKASLKNFQYEVMAVYYTDNASSTLFDKDVSAFGLKGDFVKFLNKNGRIDCRIDFFDANGFAGMPAEALKGISSNKTIRANLSSSVMIDRSLSLNGSLIYTDSERYSGFFQIVGELRAYF